MRNLSSNGQAVSDARNAILGSIREQLAASKSLDAVHDSHKSPLLGVRHSDDEVVVTQPSAATSLLEMFSRNLQSVGAHCFVAASKSELAKILADTIAHLQTPNGSRLRIAISDAPEVPSLLKEAALPGVETETTPAAADLFGFDVGISTAQAAIAETGTLVLDSESERHRLISLVPPVHIAIVDAATLCRTLGEALAGVRSSRLSRLVTFITGPSRTADIELTLAIGVHGPKELYVIVDNSAAATAKG